MKTILESAVTTEYSRLLLLEGVEITDEELMVDMMRVPVHVISAYLGLKKTKADEGGTALAVKEENGSLIIAGIVKYHPAETEDQSGNWSYEFTTNAEDLAGCHVYLVNDMSFNEVLTRIAKQHRVIFKDNEYASVLINCFFNALKNVLRDNAIPTEDYEIESEGYFTAVSSIEGDEVVYAIIPSGEMKRLIKDDSCLEKL